MAPLGSVTTPRILPVICCAYTPALKPKTTKHIHLHRRIETFRTIPWSKIHNFGKGRTTPQSKWRDYRYSEIAVNNGKVLERWRSSKNERRASPALRVAGHPSLQQSVTFLSCVSAPTT